MSESIKIQEQCSIDRDLYHNLKALGIIDDSNVRSHHVGESNYSQNIIQPWTIWKAYNLDPWDADIVKRVLRYKGTTDQEILKNRIDDYHKIIHLCKEKLRQFGNVEELQS